VQFVGLPSTALIEIGAVAGAAVVGLYILKLRRRPVAVAFSKVWQRVLRDEETSSLFSQLKRILSLLLQLVLLALLVLALGDPRGLVGRSGRNIVILVDTSASMKATDVATYASPNRTRLDDAREATRRIIGGLGGTDRALIAAMDATVTPLCTLTADTADLLQASGALRATDTRADFARALRFAVDVLQGLPSPEIIVVSDGALGEARDASGGVRLGAVKFGFVPVGKRDRNVGITQLTARRYPLDRDRYEVMIELTSTSSQPEDVELTLLGDGKVVDVSRLRLVPGERLPRFYPNLSGADRTLEARIAPVGGGHDDLAADDRAYALLPDKRRIRVACVTAGDTYLEAALLLTAYLDVTYLAPGQYPPPPGKAYDVTIFDGVAPPVAPASGSILYLNPSGPDSPVKVDGVLHNVGFDTVDKKSPLLKWTAIEDAFIGKARRLVPEPGDRIVGASEKGALMVSGRRATRFVALGFDPRESDLVLRIAWPVLILNILGDFVAEDASYLSSFRTGEVWRIPIPALSDEVRLTAPDGTERRLPVQQGRAVFFGRQAGFYTVEAGPKGAATTSRIAANLVDASESAIEPRALLSAGGDQAERVEPTGGGIRSEWWIVLLLAAALLTTIEWATYHRRITV
jgi:von Willebrand factor type A domain/Aerotolerance regulator N-terminal